jgi:hypothetical protein
VPFISMEALTALTAYKEEYVPVAVSYIHKAIDLGNEARSLQSSQHDDNGLEENPRPISPTDDDDRPEVNSAHPVQTHDEYEESPQGITDPPELVALANEAAREQQKIFDKHFGPLGLKPGHPRYDDVVSALDMGKLDILLQWYTGESESTGESGAIEPKA